MNTLILCEKPSQAMDLSTVFAKRKAKWIYGNFR